MFWEMRLWSFWPVSYFFFHFIDSRLFELCRTKSAFIQVPKIIFRFELLQHFHCNCPQYCAHLSSMATTWTSSIIRQRKLWESYQNVSAWGMLFLFVIFRKYSQVLPLSHHRISSNNHHHPNNAGCTCVCQQATAAAAPRSHGPVCGGSPVSRRCNVTLISQRTRTVTGLTSMQSYWEHVYF